MASLLDPQLSLAISVHTRPGLHSLLLGSGISRAAGIPTGAQLLQRLVHRMAALSSTSAGGDVNPVDTFDEKEWWDANSQVPLTYSNVLAASAGSADERRALLRDFFEPPADDADPTLRRPTRAHRSIASLVKQGFIRVIITTNFDRLLETALREIGVEPIVLSTASDIQAGHPVQHEKCVIIKLHGDYLDLVQKNTTEELSEYEESTSRRLDRLLDEYGLIVSGWSGESDLALVEALRRNPVRRFPTYWATFGQVSAETANLLALYHATELPNTGADELFSCLEKNLEVLERLSEDPVTTAVKVGRVKRYLLDPTKRIDLIDLFISEAEIVCRVIDQFVVAPNPADDKRYLADMDHLNAAVLSLLKMAAVGSYYDVDGAHDALWSRLVQKLANAGNPRPHQYQEGWTELQRLPAMLLLWTIGAAATASQRDASILNILLGPQWKDTSGERRPAYEALHPYTVLDTTHKTLTHHRHNPQHVWQGAHSRVLRAYVSEGLAELQVHGAELADVLDRWEYGYAVALKARKSRNPWIGLYIGTWESNPQDEPTFAETAFVDMSDEEVWSSALDISVEELGNIQITLNSDIITYRRAND